MITDDLGRPVYGWLPNPPAGVVGHQHAWEEQFREGGFTVWWCRHPACFASWLTKEVSGDHSGGSASPAG